MCEGEGGWGGGEDEHENVNNISWDITSDYKQLFVTGFAKRSYTCNYEYLEILF